MGRVATSCSGRLALELLSRDLRSQRSQEYLWFHIRQPAPALSGSSHPFFARVVGSDAFQSVGIAQVVSRLLGFRRVATVACSDAYCVSGMAAFHDAARAQGVAVLATAAFSTEQQNLSTPLTILHASGASVFVVFAAQPQDASRLLEQAQAHGIVGDGALPR